MKAKKFLALLCAVAVGLTLLVLPSSATGSLFFLSLNDTLPAQSVQTAPIQSSGWVYVPTGVFNSRTTGINFGVYYGLTDNNESLVLYNLSGKTMTFHLDTDTATTSTGETPVPGRVLRQNGQYYVPAYAVCRFFGLTPFVLQHGLRPPAAHQGQQRRPERQPLPELCRLHPAQPDQQPGLQ